MPPLIVFTIETLAEKGQGLKPHMAVLIARLLQTTQIAIVCDDALSQILTFVVEPLPPNALLTRLHLFTGSGTELYQRQNGMWNKVHEEEHADTNYLIRKISEETRLPITEIMYIDKKDPTETAFFIHSLLS